MRFRILLVTLATLAAGCGDPPPSSYAPLLPNLASQPTTAPSEELQAENLRLRAEIRVLEQERDDLLKREERLAAELRNLKFLSEQQAKQLEAVADAPKQRDYYRRQAEKLTAEKEELLKQAQELRRQLPQTQPKAATTRAAE